MAKLPVHASDQEIINALEKFDGNYRMAAYKLKIGYGTIVKRAQQNPEIKQCRLDMIANRDDIMVEMAEENIFNAVESGDIPASKYVLDRRAKEKWGKSVQIVDPEVPYPQPSWD